MNLVKQAEEVIHNDLINNYPKPMSSTSLRNKRRDLYSDSVYYTAFTFSFFGGV